MMTIIRLELLRVARDKRYWFFSLIGVPVLLPALLLIFAFALASFGTVEPQAVRPVLATTASDESFLQQLKSEGLRFDQVATREEVITALTRGDYSVGLVDVELEPGRPMQATLMSAGNGSQLPIYRSVQDAVHAIAVQRRSDLVESLDFDGPSFDLLLSPLVLSQERAPERLPSGLQQLVALLWCALLVFPYLLLTWNGGSRAVLDRQAGYLAALNASAIAPWKWLMARWVALSSVAIVLLLYSAILFALYMRAYATFADMVVAEGVLENLSEQSARSAQAYLVDAVAIWRDTSFLSYTLWLLVAMLQLATAAAIVLWGSVKASSLAQYRLFELLPFAVIFLLPLMGLGALGQGVSNVSWVPGLNTVLNIEHVVAGGLPDVTFFATAGIAVLANALVASLFLLFGVLALRNERLWAP